jgi:hypothetical protein
LFNCLRGASTSVCHVHDGAGGANTAQRVEAPVDTRGLQWKQHADGGKRIGAHRAETQTVARTAGGEFIGEKRFE